MNVALAPLRLLRRLALLALALLLLGLLAVGYLALTFDPNDYRDDLVALVESRTGRAFAIDGGLRLHLDPPLVGFAAAGVSFDNAPGFARGPMLRVGRAEVHLELLQLLAGRLQIRSLHLNDVELALHRKAGGRANWDGLWAPAAEAAAATAAETEAAPPVRVALRKFRLSDGRVSFRDDPAGRRVELRELRLAADGLAPGEAAAIELAGALRLRPAAGDGGRIDARVDLRGGVAADLDLERIAVRDAQLELELAGPAFPFERLDVAATAEEFSLDRAGERFFAHDAELRAAGAEARFETLEGRLGADGPEASGRLRAAGIDPRRWLELLALAPPLPADPDTLRGLELQGGFQAHAGGLQVSALEATLDRTTLAGEFSVLDFDAPRIAFDLRLGELDLDPYLPLADDGGDEDGAAGAEPRGDAAAAGPGWPRLDGRLSVERLHWRGLELARASARAIAGQDRFELESLTGRVNNGALRAGGAVDAGGGIPAYRLDLHLDQLEAGRVLSLFSSEGRTPLEGAAELDLALAARGRNTQSLLSSLGGTLGISVRHGTLHVGSVAHAVEEAVAALQFRRSETTAEGKLPFDLLRSSWNATDGRLLSRDLELRAGALALSGQGHIDLARRTVDYQMSVASGGGLRVPVRVSGPFGDLSHSVDLSALVKDQITRGVEDLLGLDPGEEDEADDGPPAPDRLLHNLLDQLF